MKFPARALTTVAFFLTAMYGCATTPPIPVVKINAEFDSLEAAKVLTHGNNTIKGSALWRQSGGGVVTCAGGQVGLVPATAYAIERIEHLYGNSTAGALVKQLEFEPDPVDFKVFVRSVQCDAQGYFSFTRVPDGDYFAITSVSWAVANRMQGGPLMERVSVAGGDTKEIVLSP